MDVRPTRRESITSPLLFSPRGVRVRPTDEERAPRQWCCPTGAVPCRRSRARPRGKNAHPQARTSSTRLIREGDLGSCEAYLDEWWSTPDLAGLRMDLVSCRQRGGLRRLSRHGVWCAPYERMRFWLQSNSKRQGKKNIASFTTETGKRVLRAVGSTNTMNHIPRPVRDRAGTDGGGTDRQNTPPWSGSGRRSPRDHVLENGCGLGRSPNMPRRRRGLARQHGPDDCPGNKHELNETVASHRPCGLVGSGRVSKLQEYRDEARTVTGGHGIALHREMSTAVGDMLLKPDSSKNQTPAR